MSLFNFIGSFSGTNVGEIKINSSMSIFDNSFFRATKAYIEKHDAAAFSFEFVVSDDFNSSPNKAFILPIICIVVYFHFLLSLLKIALIIRNQDILNYLKSNLPSSTSL
jgi:hypothetical protein